MNKKFGTYDCSRPKGCWKEGFYQIDFADDRQRNTDLAIWHNRAWAVSGIRSAKQAIGILKAEFESVRKLEE